MAAVVLAAGASTRMGEPKPLVDLGGRPLLAHVLSGVRQSAAAPIVVVLGHEAERVRRGVDLGGTVVVENPDYRKGMSTSLRRGIEALPETVGGFLVVLGDQPLLSPKTLDRLVESFRGSGARIIIPTYRGVRGNPVLLERSLAPEVEAISGDQGCRAIFREHEHEILEVPVDDPGILIDVDSREDLEGAREVIEGRAAPEAILGGPALSPPGGSTAAGSALAGVLRRAEVEEVAAKLRSRNEPFALATVVRAVRPTSGRPGYKALVLPTGELIGWIGGSCSRAVVIQEGLAALGDGRPRFLRFSPGPDPLGEEGVVGHSMECRSGGTLEIFVEPNLPRPRLLVVGDSPVAAALTVLGRLLGYRVTLAAPRATREAFPAADEVVADLAGLPDLATPRTYAVVATMQRYDAQALAALAPSPAPYVALVASRRRGSGLLQDLRRRGIPGEALDRVRSPAGLDLAAETPEEIALSIMAEITRFRHTTPALSRVPREAPSPTRARDPVCGMEVEEDSLLQVAHGGKVYHFCSDACRMRFQEAPEAFLG